jgi:drug/metabolite transporter (DMT)-like permease
VFPVASPRVRAIAQALFVTFLWSTSWVFIKSGLSEIPALVFAGLRYGLAFLVLLPFALRAYRQLLHAYPEGAPLRRHWPRLVLLGLISYGVTQGAQYLSLFYLPAANGSWH